MIDSAGSRSSGREPCSAQFSLFPEIGITTFSRKLVGPQKEVTMLDELKWVRIPCDGSDHPASPIGRSGRSQRLTRLLSAAIALAVLACASERTATEPSDKPNGARDADTHAAADPTVAVHPSKNLDPSGRTVTVIGKGFPPNVTVQLAECTGSPLMCQALMNVDTNEHGMFVSRVLLAFDFTVFVPFGPTCSEPTFTGDECLLFAQATSGASSAFEPITFSR
jgi:hypothetical protein